MLHGPQKKNVSNWLAEGLTVFNDQKNVIWEVTNITGVEIPNCNTNIYGGQKTKTKKIEKTIFSVAVGNKQTKTRYVCNFFYQFLLNSSKKNSSAGEFFVGTIFDPLEERC